MDNETKEKAIEEKDENKVIKSYKDLIGQQKTIVCNTEEELKELWEVISKSAYDNRFLNSNILRVPQLGDTILYYQQRSLEGKPFIWRSEVVSFPPKCATNMKKVLISGIGIVDTKKTGMGGEATILDGGIGAHFVDIKLTSQWFRGYSFTIIIIGKYLDENESEVNSVGQTLNPFE